MEKVKKINVEEVCAAYNTARTANAGRKMPREKVLQILKDSGLSENISKRLVKCATFFTSYKRENAGKGKHIGYIWPVSPIHVNIFKNWLYPVNEAPKKKEITFEEECAEYLRKQGYQLKKCVGFDEDSFKKDYPQLWSKYLIYEEV